MDKTMRHPADDKLKEAVHGLRIAVQALAHAATKDATYQRDYDRVSEILGRVSAS